MKKQLLIASLAVLFLASVALFSCKKEVPVATDAGLDLPIENSQESGRFKKNLTIADETGQNEVKIELSTDDEKLFNAFNESVFSLEAVDAREHAAQKPAQTTAPQQPAHSIEPRQSAGSERRYFVQVLGKKMGPGVSTLQLNVKLGKLKGESLNLSGWFTNNSNMVGIINNAVICNYYLDASFYFRTVNHWFLWKSKDNENYFLYSVAPPNTCMGGLDGTTILRFKAPCQLLNFRTAKHYGEGKGIFTSNGGLKTAMTVKTGEDMTNTGNSFGVFIFE